LQIYVRLWRQLSRSRRKQCLVLFILMLVVATSEMLSIGATLPFLAMLTNPSLVTESVWFSYFPLKIQELPRDDLLYLATIAFGIFAILAGFMRLVLIGAQTRLSFAIGVDLSVKIYRNFLYKTYEEQINRNSSEIISAVTNKSNLVVSHALYPILNILSSILMLIMMVGILTSINYILALTTFVGFAFIYIFVMHIAKIYLEQDSLKVNIEQTKVIKIIQEGFGGVRDVLISGTQDIYVNAYKNAEVTLRHSMGNIQIATVSPRFIIESIAMAFIAGIAMYFVKLEDSITEIVPVLGAIALGSQRILPLLQQAYASWAAIKGGRHSVLDALSFLEEGSANNVLDGSDGLNKVFFERELSLRSVCFEYALSGKGQVLKDFDLTIEKGSCVGIIGVTGSGKTTLVDLIMGLLHPIQGCLIVDGVIIDKENVRGWQNHITHVPQNIFLSDSSIAKNIAFGFEDVDINYARLRQAAEKAQILETIESWPDGFNTTVGERGVKLSGGQRQRIGIARALYKTADVIILDEATSALDSETESTIMSEIHRLDGNLTVVMIAHRLSSLKGCDKIIEIKAGNIARIGSYEEIISDLNKLL
jgi:ABC-type multidrug transport system fused ATPase/permease subunit